MKSQIELYYENIARLLVLKLNGCNIEEICKGNIPIICKFSVPEKNTVKEEESSEDLIKETKKLITQFLFSACDDLLDEGEDIYDLASKYCRFFAKVRKGEIWTTEDYNRIMQEIKNTIKDIDYKEV